MDTSKQVILEAAKSKYLGKDLVELLTQETPEDIIEERRARGGSKVKYVAGHHFIIKLNECFGFLWSYDIPHQFEVNGQIVCKGQLTAHIPMVKRKTVKKYTENGKQIEEESTEYEILDIVKTQWGSSEIKRYNKDEALKDKRGNQVKDAKGIPLWKHRVGDVIDLGDDYKGASTDAMKKCSTELGIFLDVYATRAGEEEGGVSKDQLSAFFYRAEQAGMSNSEAQTWAEEQLGKPFKELDSLEVMGLVPKLIDIAEEKDKESDK